MKPKFTACLAIATLALASCGGEPQVDEDEVDPTFEGAGDTSSSMGAGALTEAAPDEAVTDEEAMMDSDAVADTTDGDMEPGYEIDE